MEKETILKTGKYISLVVMILTGLIVAIQGFGEFWNTQTYGNVIIAFGVFLVALRGYLKDHYGVV